ncbi:uncharacterized protein BDZ99DRAFT_473538 [Mytilinidion resinicola]|uniref:Xaa-Pro dipeptidyl-peptidase C-terminal domain-containing protein n=1 Tax=Mytilinidion resinicola TaxID=574789 RepID=A0A6A6Z1E2_9PEZI|nr:uncharacterized protein BDZ99DRAFT_473538 [Mytilinidion resinicola]KAF2814483.1 hypothetical protein BDZ99DRAFT_473538 [Mytilinidion resinicola]
MDKMIIERDVPILSDDTTLRADIFRPKDSFQYPVIMTMGPYGKGNEYKTGYAAQWKWLTTTHPNILPGSSRSFMTWETVDPETWFPGATSSSVWTPEVLGGRQDPILDWSKLTVPFLSATNLAGFGLHPRGNFEAFMHAASEHKWLECHPGRHEEWFYLEQGIDIQKRFLDCFLKDLKNGWMEEAPVSLRLRRPFEDNEFELRREEAWPLSSTQWTETYLSAAGDATTLSWNEPGTASSVSSDALGKPLTFLSPPLESETEITGPLAAKLFTSSSTADMDLFVTLQAFSPEGKEADFQGTVGPHTPLAQSWLWASHRKLDPAKSLPYRPYHSHDEISPVKLNEVYELNVEIWPTSIILPAGFRLALQISGKPFEREVPGKHEVWVAKGSGPWLHTNVEDRPESIFGGRRTVHTGGEYAIQFAYTYHSVAAIGDVTPFGLRIEEIYQF